MTVQYWERRATWRRNRHAASPPTREAINSHSGSSFMNWRPGNSHSNEILSRKRCRRSFAKRRNPYRQRLSDDPRGTDRQAGATQRAAPVIHGTWFLLNPPAAYTSVRSFKRLCGEKNSVYGAGTTLAAAQPGSAAA